MKNPLLLASLAAGLSGCSSLTGYNASEIHQTVSYPLVFNDTIDATGISKETAADGTVTRKAGSLTHDLTICGFKRTATYKDAVLETKAK